MKSLLLIIILLVSVGCAPAYAQSTRSYVPSGSLVAWYPFTGNAIDSSGTGNNGTAHYCTLTTDRFGNPNSAYYFNGTSSYVMIPSSATLDLVKEMSIAAWIKTDDYSGADAQIFWRGDSRSAADPYMLFVTGGDVSFRRDCGSGYSTYQIGFPGSIIDTSRFHLIVGTYSMSGDSMRLYYDGYQIASTYASTRLSYSTSGFWNVIGSVDNGSWQHFKGIIDDVGAWNRRLEQCEILKMYLGRTNLILSGPVDDSSVLGSGVNFSIHDTGSLGYTWQYNNGRGFVNVPATAPFTGINNDTLFVTSVDDSMCGYQFRCIIGSGNCQDTSGIGTILCRPRVTTGIGVVYENSNSFRIIPNPNNGTFKVKGGNNGVNSPSTIQVYDLLGRCVYHVSFTPSASGIDEEVSLSAHLPGGCYTVRVFSDNMNVVTTFVKEL